MSTSSQVKRRHIGAPLALLLFALIVELLVATEGLPNAVRLWLSPLCEQIRYLFLTDRQLMKAPPQITEIELYMSVTLLLLPCKVYFFAEWLARNSNGSFYRQFVISPRALGVAEPPSNWVREGERAREPARRSGVVPFISMLLGSALVLALSAGFVFLLLHDFGAIPYKDREPLAITRATFRALYDGGLSAWIAWSIYRTGIASLLIAGTLCMLRDYFTALYVAIKKLLIDLSINHDITRA